MVSNISGNYNHDWYTLKPPIGNTKGIGQESYQGQGGFAGTELQQFKAFQARRQAETQQAATNPFVTNQGLYSAVSAIGTGELQPNNDEPGSRFKCLYA